MHKRHPFLLSLCLFTFLPFSSLTQGNEVHKESLAQENPVSQESSVSAGKKKILDLVRRGVVMVNVKTFANAQSSEKETWVGTGFIVDREKGIIATNHHVVGDMTVSSYQVKLFNGSYIEAKLIPTQSVADYAFLKVDPSKLPKEALALEFSLNPITLNQTVYAMGNSAHEEFSTFKGTVFSVYENFGPENDQSFSFSGITVGGASGSPIFDENGKVVGILYGGKFISGTGLPIKYVVDALEVIQQDKIFNPYKTGIHLNYNNLEDYEKAGFLPGEAVKEYKKLFPESGNKVTVVYGVTIGTEAAKKIENGDVLWKVNGKHVGPNIYDFDKEILKSEGNPVQLTLYRDGKLLDITLTPFQEKMEPRFKFLTFADATWFEGNSFIKYFYGDDKPGVFFQSMQQTSPFSKLLRGAEHYGKYFMGYNKSIIKVTGIDDTPIKTLEDLRKIIPQLAKKRVFSVRYIDYVGAMGLGIYASMDRQEKLQIINYESRFDSPKMYKFNYETHEWDTDTIHFDMPKEETSSAKSLPASLKKDE